MLLDVRHTKRTRVVPLDVKTVGIILIMVAIHSLGAETSRSSETIASTFD